jgi:calpain-15
MGNMTQTRLENSQNGDSRSTKNSFPSFKNPNHENAQLTFNTIFRTKTIDPLYSAPNHLDHYVDPEFPPNNTSLFINGNKMMRKTIIHSSGFKQIKTWLRPHQIYCGTDEKHFPISLFNNPTPKDVIQGELGTCWFLSALALIVERPLLLVNVVLTKQYNNTNGIHEIRLCKRGEWKVIAIDDYLPCDKHNQLVFSYGRRRQFWVPFIEKALAKMYGSYESIGKGACAEGLQTLTGEPCEVLYLRSVSTRITTVNPFFTSNPDDKTIIWNKIFQSKNNGYLMTTLCYNENLADAVFDKYGLLNRHIYSILDVKEFYETNGTKYKLLRLRNPWGHKEWKGAWSDNWSQWPNHVKAQVSVYNKDDGCFWISFEDVMKYFYDITICKVRTDWSESRLSSCFYDFSNGFEAYLLTVTHHGIHEFEIELFSTGYFSRGFDRNADPSFDLCIILCRVENGDYVNGLTCVAFEHSVEYYITVSTNLQPGQYTVFATSIKAISPLNSFNKKYDYASYNIAFHGKCPFAINKIRLHSEIVSEMFFSVARMQRNFKEELDGQVRTYVVQGSCTHGIYIENLSYNMWLDIQLDTTGSTNLESTRLATKTFNTIPPRTRELLAFLTPINYRSGYVIGYKLETKPSANRVEVRFPFISPNYAGLHAARNF